MRKTRRNNKKIDYSKKLDMQDTYFSIVLFFSAGAVIAAIVVGAWWPIIVTAVGLIVLLGFINGLS